MCIRDSFKETQCRSYRFIIQVRDTTCSFSKEQWKITPLLLESYWVSGRKNSRKRFELATLETVHQLPIYVRLWIVPQSHFSQEWERGRNTTSTQIFFLLVLLTVHQISYQDKVLLFCYFWSLLIYLNFQQEILKIADELLCARATRAQTGTKLVVNRKRARIQTLVVLWPTLQKKVLNL